MAFCGAKTRGGEPCKNGAMPNGRCRMHGGKSTQQWGNKKAVKHGIYESGLTKEEKKIYKNIDVTAVDDEIRLCKLRIRRAMIARKEVEEQPEDITVGFETSEIKQVQGDSDRNGTGATQTRREMTRKRPDYDAIIDKFMGRMGQLIKTRAEVAQSDTVDASTVAKEFSKALSEIENMTANVNANG